MIEIKKVIFYPRSLSVNECEYLTCVTKKRKFWCKFRVRFELLYWKFVWLLRG